MALPAQAQAQPWPGTAEAARSDWDAQQPPANGWVPVKVPNDWNQQWPGYSGVVWYRLRWDIAGQPQTQGLYIHYLMQAGVIAVNGVELQRDPQLTEPMTRAWNTPRYLVLPAPLLHSGSNELLIRVSGYYAYQPALGPVEIGRPELLRTAQQHSYLVRHNLNWLHLGAGATLGCFFLVLWLMRRQEAAYGWYAARQAAWVGFTVNFVSATPWPFHNLNTYAAMVSVAYVLYHGCNAMFVLRFMGRRWPRREAGMWLAIAVLSAATLLVPEAQLRDMRNLMAWASSALLFTTAGVFVGLAWRNGNQAQRLLSLTALPSALAMAHDLLVFTRIVDDNFYLATYTEPLATVGIALTLAWTFVQNTRRVESFNDEMQHHVAEARAELTESLAGRHELELLQARLGERVNIAHDLHDGLGGMLIGNITTLERTRGLLPPDQVLGMLRGMRDDLRLIIDLASAQHYGELSLGELLAPMRHRMSQLFEVHGIEVHWQLSHIEQLHLPTSASLDVLRILQEALTNAFKHSQARRVDVLLAREAGQLLLQVQDNGVGLPAAKAANTPTHGTGLRSMQARAQRLGAQLWVGSQGGRTLVELRVPLPAEAEVRDVPEA
ncbi:ATP-binding protein [Comamonas sp.]|uniref:sensor histidine kinase n=1 Tax=Comamonas sp. TaxID=34028 RepID=UPI0028A1141E|nr:ATP-binding protein [Comamonas sp.]